MYEFRCTAAGTVQFNANGVTLYDNMNVSRSSISTTSQKYFKFQRIFTTVSARRNQDPLESF